MPTNDAHAMIPPDHTVVIAGATTVDPVSRQYMDCDAEFRINDLDVPVVTMCLLLFIAGILYCVAGYRLFKCVLFTTGLLFGSVTVYVVCSNESVMPLLANAAISLGAGVLFGLITMLVEYVGLFLTGFLAGVHLGVIGLTAVSLMIRDPYSIWLHICVLFLCGIIMALLTLKWSRPALIVGTALMGGAMCILSVDYITQRWANAQWLYDLLSLKHPPPPCWHAWLLFACWPTLLLLGLVLQVTVTGHRRTIRKHQPVPNSSVALHDVRSGSGSDLVKPEPQRRKAHAVIHRQAAVISTTSTPPSSTPSVSPKRKMSFRSLYQARRRHGDIICQSFMASVDRSRQSTDTATLSSDHTRITVCSNSTPTASA